MNHPKLLPSWSQTTLGRTASRDIGAELITAMAHYYASQPPAKGIPGNANLVTEGYALFHKGDPTQGLPACASCHGAHEILPSSDTASSISPKHLEQTCGSCHPGIGAGVTQGKIHVASVRADINGFAWGVQWFYYLLIAGIIAFAASMIALDQYRHRVVDPRRRGDGHG